MSKDLKLHRNLLWVLSATQLCFHCPLDGYVKKKITTDVEARDSRKPGFHPVLPLEAFNGPDVALLFSMPKFSPTTKYPNAHASFAIPHVLFLLTAL